MPAGMRGFIGDERGSITVVMFSCLALVAMLCLLVTDVGLYLKARNEAQNAADAAAIAAVQESFPLLGTGRSPEEAASRLSRANGAKLERLVVHGGGERTEVTVSVQPRLLLLGRMGLSAGSATASAAAEVDIEALLASGEIWYSVDPELLRRISELAREELAKNAGSLSTAVVILALQHLGKPYVWGATGPDGFDCSGLVYYVFAQLGIRLPRVTFSQVSCGRAVSRSQLAPGDLVFFRHNGHVGIYVGGGYYIHAPHTGDVVKLSPLSSRADLSACRRIF